VILTCLLGLALVGLLPGCGRPADRTPRIEEEGKATPDAGDFPRTVTDSLGHSLEITQRPLRIVSTAPSNTEVLFAIGAGPQVVGVTTYCNYPSEATQRDKIGGFAPKTISLERIVQMRPNLILCTGRIQQQLVESLRGLQLPVLAYDAQTLDDVLRNIRSLGQATGNTDQAEMLAAELEKRLARVRSRFEGLPADKRPRVLFLQALEPLMIAGPKTFVGQMIDLAGGQNLFADLEQAYPRVSEEEIVRRNPSVLFTWERGDSTSRKERLAKRPAWAGIDAVRQGRIITLDEDMISRPGPRLFDGLEQLADLLHPSPERGPQ
jgi:iron complex transport system substrate-binding protein